MKLKTSITLSEDIVKQVKKFARKNESRSQSIERLLSQAFEEEKRRAVAERDLDLINKFAKELNREAEDVLEYQEDEN